MIFAARCGFSGSTFAATSIESKPSALVSKIGVISRMIRPSSRRLVRASVSSTDSPACSATGANGSGDEREARLQEVHQPLVRLVERDRGAALARADLRLRYASHPAASFA